MITGAEIMSVKKAELPVNDVIDTLTFNIAVQISAITVIDERYFSEFSHTIPFSVLTGYTVCAGKKRLRTFSSVACQTVMLCYGTEVCSTS